MELLGVHGGKEVLDGNMKFSTAGGGEHSRSCFGFKGEGVCFLVDCGKMAGSKQLYPNFFPEQVWALQYVFLTHSHTDHSGALPWLLEQGFSGTVVASSETFRHLPFALPKTKPLYSLLPPVGLRLH